MKTLIESLNWRYAVKKYDPAKKLNPADLVLLKEALRLAPSSFGLQPYHILFIEDMEMREKLRAASFNQPQITEAACLVVLAAKKRLDEAYIDDYFENVADTRKIPLEGHLDKYKQAVIKTFAEKPVAVQTEWSARQAFLAMGFLLSAVAQLGIDANPMEGFIPAAYDEIPGLKEKGLSSVVIAGLVYRHPDDAYQHLKKVRKPAEELFINL